MVMCHHSLISVPTSFINWDIVWKANMCMWWVLKNPDLHVHPHTHIFAKSLICSPSISLLLLSWPWMSQAQYIVYYCVIIITTRSSFITGRDYHECMGVFPIHDYSIFPHIQMSSLTKWTCTWDWVWFMPFQIFFFFCFSI